MNIPIIVGIILGAFAAFGLLLFVSMGSIFFVCGPNQVLIFSGRNRRSGDRKIGYRVVKGGSTLRNPFLEKVDGLDLTNMIIELNAIGAYGKGGVPLNVQGVANVKVAGHEPVLNNAIERFLGKGRQEIMGIAKATLEGSLRGVLATLTPEQVNEDRNLFAERLVQEVEQDMTALGLVVDTLKVQNITDDVKYLDSIGRIRSAELLSSARVAEATARADSAIRSAENELKEVEAQIRAQISVAKADADKGLTDAVTRRDAVVAEQNADVAAMLAKAEAEIKVQAARIEQVRRQLEADVVAPAKAECEALEQQAAAAVAPIVEDGRARADALTRLAESWTDAGDQAREIFILQKIEPIIRQLTETIGKTKIEKLTVIDTRAANGGMDAGKLLAMNAQVKEVFGIDVAAKLAEMASKEPERPAPYVPEPVHRIDVSPTPTPIVEPNNPTPPPRRRDK
ncbi:MAG: hypothetical protein KIT11_08400 [Fimbriimonadaceae bacterium]|nr:hypothetical protein [Fimbriimonadaceae bacterium]QYK56373.1 MAG: hypothetical protein KF733_02595 [Fimbriimonadaceae bacterium]